MDRNSRWGERTRVALALITAATLFAACTAAHVARPNIRGVQPLLGKSLLRRGGNLQEDVTRFLRSGYVLIGYVTYTVKDFAEGAERGSEAGKQAGAHLVLLYENLEINELEALQLPLTIPEPTQFSSTAEILASIRPQGMVTMFWARTGRSSAFGAYVYEQVSGATKDPKTKGKYVEIQFVVKRSPALLGGLMTGDLVTAVNGETITGNAHSFLQKVAAMRGHPTEFTFLRDGDTHRAVIDLLP